MKILVEHPFFTPYTEEISGGTEVFMRDCVKALKARGHEVEVFASADSTMKCRKSSCISTVASTLLGKNTKMKQWYKELMDASKDYDTVLLNSTLSSSALISPEFGPLFAKSSYINHNASGWFTTGFAGRHVQLNSRLMRSFGGRTYYLCEWNRDEFAKMWNSPKGRELVIGGKVNEDSGRFKGNTAWLDVEMWDGHFNEAVAMKSAARKPEGYLVAIGRPDKNKRLERAGQLAKKLNKKLIVFTLSSTANIDKTYVDQVMSALSEAEVRVDRPRAEIMDVLSRADCMLLPSMNETFSIAAFEAMCHGVPVCYLDKPPALDLYPSLGREWGDVEPNTLAERREAHKLLNETYTLDAFGQRLETILQR